MRLLEEEGVKPSIFGWEAQGVEYPSPMDADRVRWADGLMGASEV